MIFSDEECDFALTVKQRKGVELSVYHNLEEVPISVRSAMISQLELDISRCDAF